VSFEWPRKRDLKPKDDEARAAVALILERAHLLPPEFTARMVQRKGWGGDWLSAGVAKVALERLTRDGHLDKFSHMPGETGGRPSTVFRKKSGDPTMAMKANERAFHIQRIKRGDTEVNAVRMQCAKCEAVAYWPQNGHRAKPPEAVTQHFRNHGWSIGNGPRMDVCPECQKRRPELKVVKMETSEAPKAEPPREMGREDRRIITDKLDEVYDEKAVRYRSPWTDAAVARDLGVPRAWVGEVREQFFGPEGSNPEFDDFLEKAAPIIAEMKNMANSLRVQSERYKELEPRIAEIERIGKRLEREVGR